MSLSSVFLGAQSFYAPGQIQDVAGTPGKRSFAGDGGDSLAARLANPLGVAVDRRGNIYFSDTLNHRIRKVDQRTGRIETVAGTGEKGFKNDGGNAEMATLNGPTGIAFDTLGNLYIADTGNQRIRMLTPNGVKDTMGTACVLRLPVLEIPPGWPSARAGKCIFRIPATTWCVK